VVRVAKVVFAGTPEFSVPCLRVLLEAQVKVVGVFSQPDRVAGRGKKIQQSPVKQCAIQAGIDVFQPQSLKQAAAQERLADLQADLMIVVAYGLILPQSVLDIPALGCINVHASLLPRWRGAAPIQRAIEAGDEQSGVCLMQMDKGLDTGPVFACRQHQISPEQTGGMLHDTLSSLGADLLRDKLDDILNRKLTPQPQATNGLSYAHKLSKDDSRMQWQLSATQLANKIRAFTPWPVMTANINGQAIRFHQANALANSNQSSAQAGEIIALSGKGIEVQTANGRLNITKLQKPGAKILSTRDFLNGFRLSPGQRFE
jgi:methionyl-tRNA formyltransferase